ncbi:MAG: hypothetical protein R2699_08285 [Acidimicrobiales bacterium]
MATATRTPNRRLAWLLIIIGVVGGTITLLSLDRRTGTTVDVQLNVSCPSLIIYTDGDDRWWAGDEPVIDGPLRTEAERAGPARSEPSPSRKMARSPSGPTPVAPCAWNPTRTSSTTSAAPSSTAPPLTSTLPASLFSAGSPGLPGQPRNSSARR